MRFWSVPPEEVPAGRQERIEWLYDWWARIDEWIDAHQPAPRPRTGPPAARRLSPVRWLPYRFGPGR